MAYYSLEKAIATPPALIANRSSKSGDKKMRDGPATSVHCNKSSLLGVPKENLLSRWSDRPTIQSFMNHVSSLSARKQQQLQQQQQQLQQQIQQKIQQDQQKQRQEQLRQKQVQQQHVNYNSPFGSHTKSFLNKVEGLSNNTTLSPSQTKNIGLDITLQESSQRRVKVRKVMKGGVLVSMPCGVRQPPVKKSIEHIPRGESDSMMVASNKNKFTGFKTGNILDDILARTKDNSQESVVTKGHKKISKVPLTENVVASTKLKSTGTDIPPVKAKSSEVGQGLVDSSVTEHDIVHERDLGTKNDNGVSPLLLEKLKTPTVEIKETKTLVKSINTRKVSLTEKKLKNSACKDKLSTLLVKSKQQPSRSGVRQTPKGKTNAFKMLPVESIGYNATNFGTTNLESSLQGKDIDSLHDDESTNKDPKTDKGELCQSTSLGYGNESDGSGELVIDIDTSFDLGKDCSPQSLKKSRYSYTSDSSDSSDAVLTMTSFDRIRALSKQYIAQNSTLANTAESREVQNRTQSCSSMSNDLTNKLESSKEDEGLFGGDQPETQQFNLKTDESANGLKGNLQETSQTSSLKTNASFVKNNTLASEDPSELCKNKMETSFSETASESMNDCLSDPESLNIIAIPAEDTVLARSDKTEDVRENERKRKETMDDMALIKAKWKKAESSQKANNAQKTGQESEIVNKRSSIQTKRKRNRKNNRSVKPQSEHGRRITRSMSNSCTEESPPKPNNTKPSCSTKSSPSSKKVSVKIESPKNASRLLSNVSDEAIDVTVANEELSAETRKRKRSKGKKKRKEPTEWFLRKQEQARGHLPWKSEVSKDISPVCLFFLRGKCAKGATCSFRHEKTKELCSYYAGQNGCHRFKDGMCPNLHNEFPCMYFHKKQFCLFSDNCKFSHEPLTEETREILDNYLVSFMQRKTDSSQDSPSTNVEKAPVALEQGKAVLNESEKGIAKEITKSNSGSLEAASSREDSTTEVASTSVASKMSSLSGLKYPATTHTSSKPIDSPKVKRLCSLSSYKPQILSSFVSSLKSPQRLDSKFPTESKHKNLLPKTTNFLPGMFKEK